MPTVPEGKHSLEENGMRIESPHQPRHYDAQVIDSPPVPHPLRGRTAGQGGHGMNEENVAGIGTTEKEKQERRESNARIHRDAVLKNKAEEKRQSEVSQPP